jgi:hypothetical protein
MEIMAGQWGCKELHECSAVGANNTLCPTWESFGPVLCNVASTLQPLHPGPYFYFETAALLVSHQPADSSTE